MATSISLESIVLNIYFVFPYKGVGGVPVVFVRIAEHLATRGLINAYIVDYTDGAMADIMDSKLCKFLPYDDENEIDIPSGSIAVFQTMTPWSIFPKLKMAKDVRLFFWNCHPFNLVPTLGFSPSIDNGKFDLFSLLFKSVLRPWKNKLNKFLNLLLEKFAIGFMDEQNVVVTSKYLEVPVKNPNYIPIPVSNPHNLIEQIDKIRNEKIIQSYNKKTINIVWVGRIVDFKFYILKATLERLNEIAREHAYTFNLTILGTGEKIDDLQQICLGLKFLTIEFEDHIELSLLEDYLLNKADMIMAMGSSVLEGAKSKIPSILLDFSYQEVPLNYNYTWLNERFNYTLGDLIQKEHLTDNRESLNRIIDELISRPLERGQMCYDYVRHNHSIENASNKLVDSLGKSCLTWQDLEQARLLQRGIIYKSYSLVKLKLKTIRN